ncbi:MAG: hypothetical protein SO098_01135, partial [Prevotella sp.]|nr:hypothetical protein [Prevotella sp.]
GEETAFVPQACIIARKTLKTGWRNPYVLQKNTNFQTYELSNFQTYKLSNLQTYKTYFRIVSAEVSGPPGQRTSRSAGINVMEVFSRFSFVSAS